MSEGARFIGKTLAEVAEMSGMPPPANEPAPYGIGSDHWPGHGKAIEECAELLTVLGKLQGSGGARDHWSGDLIEMMRDEIADVRAALRFLEERNRALGDEMDPRSNLYGFSHMQRREQWKIDLFRSWHRCDPPEKWPQPEQYGLPPRKAA